jgi:hypothetical protein
MEVIEVAAPFFVEEFQGQKAQQGGRRGYPAGARIASRTDQGVETEPSQ